MAKQPKLVAKRICNTSPCPICGGCANSYENKNGHVTCDDITTYAHIKIFLDREMKKPCLKLHLHWLSIKTS
jgi:hypothetical protein